MLAQFYCRKNLQSNNDVLKSQIAEISQTNLKDNDKLKLMQEENKRLKKTNKVLQQKNQDFLRMNALSDTVKLKIFNSAYN